MEKQGIVDIEHTPNFDEKEECVKEACVCNEKTEIKVTDEVKKRVLDFLKEGYEIPFNE